MDVCDLPRAAHGYKSRPCKTRFVARCALQVVVVEQDHCGQFSYPTIQYVPDSGMVFVAYTVLFLPASMPPDCRVSRGRDA